MFKNRVTELLGVETPIIQAPMGWIARSPLASAVSEAGAMGIIETSSGDLDTIREEILKMGELTSKPFGVNIAQAFVNDPGIVEFVADNGVRFVTTSAGDPTRYTAALKDAGVTVFHVVPTLRAALKAVAAGVDGLVVEGAEGGGFKNPRDVSTMVLLPLVASKVDVPVIAAGGFLDGATMAAGLALGAEGVQLGTVMVATRESPIHDNWKAAIVGAAETDSVLLNRHRAPAVRVLRTDLTNSLEFDTSVDAMTHMANFARLYFDGEMDAALPLGGAVAGRIEAVRPVAEVIDECARGCLEVLDRLREQYLG